MKKRLAVLGIMMCAALMGTATAYAEEVTEDNEIVGGYMHNWEEDMPEDAQEAFDKAMSVYEGDKDLTAIKLIDSQVVAGINYRILCKNAAGEKIVVTIYRDPGNNCEVTDATKVITPLDQSSILDESDFTVKASFMKDDFNFDDHTLTFDAYTTALYDMVDMTQLKEGDIIEVDTFYPRVDTVTESETLRRFDDGHEENVAVLTINQDTGNEHVFVANEGGTWIEVEADDYRAQSKLGTKTLPFSDSLKFTDFPEQPGPGEEVPYEELQQHLAERNRDNFSASYTSVEVKNNEIVSITCVYVP